jgi:diadenosine tetraphosphate (Ap4A) HIT family hydrolase
VGQCIFCDIVAGRSPASVVYDDPDVMALLDINPVQRGHVLVIPKRHFVDIWDIDPEVLSKVVAVTKRVSQRMRDVWHTEGVNTFSASGKPAGQDVYHFHMHVIPLGKGERTKFAGWWLSAMGEAERSELDELAAELRFR